MDGDRFPIPARVPVRLALLNLRRRKPAGALLLLMILVSGTVCAVLGRALAAEKAALEQTVAHTRIRCTVTDLAGRSSPLLVSSTFADLLTGRGSEGEDLSPYAADVACLAVDSLRLPKEAQLRRIYSLRSDAALGELEGVRIQWQPGWDEGCLQGEEGVCLITPDIGEDDLFPGPDGSAFLTIVNSSGTARTLQVVGRVTGVTGKVVYCPFYTPYRPGSVEHYALQSASFYIRDNRLLAEAKAALALHFAAPDLAAAASSARPALLVQDGEYLSSLEKLQGNISLLRLLRTALAILTALAALFTGCLSARARLRELAVMRCLGLGRLPVAQLLLFEYLFTAAAGCALALAALSCAALPLSGLCSAALTGASALAGGTGCAFFLCGSEAQKTIKAEE